MAVSMLLHVIEPPLTPNHVICLLRSIGGGGMSTTMHLYRLGENPGQAEVEAATTKDRAAARLADAAEATIRADERLADLTRARLTPGPGDADERILRSPQVQVATLAPHLPIGESTEIPEGHPLWDHTDDGVALDHLRMEAVLDAIDASSAAQGMEPAEARRRSQAAQEFLLRHLGKMIVIIGA